MTWTERVIGVGLSLLITVGVLLATTYGPFYLMPYLRQLTPIQAAGLINVGVSIFIAWRVSRAYRTGSLKRTRYLAPIERRDHPIKFWAYISLDVLLITALGYLAWRSFSN